MEQVSGAIFFSIPKKMTPAMEQGGGLIIATRESDRLSA
jgi:hypothetical protein